MTQVGELFSGSRSIGIYWRAKLGSFINSPFVFAALIVVVLSALVTLAIFNEGRKRAIENEHKLLETFSIALAEHVEQTLQRGDQILIDNREVFLRSRATFLGQLQRHNRTVDRETMPLESVIGPDGRMLISTTPDGGIATNPVDLSDREHFRFHATSANPERDDVFISKIVLGRVSKKPVMQITRAFRSPSGELLGVGVVSVNPLEFVEPYTKMVASNRVITLRGPGNSGLMRVSKEGTQYSIDYTNKSNIRNQLMNNERGGIDAKSMIDGMSRIYGYSKIKGYPLYVLVSSDLDTVIDEPYITKNKSVLYIVALLTFSLIGLMGTALWSQGLMLKLSANNLLLQKNVREIELARSAQRHMVASLSHELRTPLHGITGHAQLLSMDLAGDPLLCESAETILKCSKDLRIIVNKLLDQERADSGKEIIRIEQVNLPALMLEVAHLHQASATRAGLEFSVEVSKIPNLIIESDSMAIKRCLHNLLSNAIKFTEKGGISLRASLSPDKTVCIVVKDTGIGIAEENLTTVFQHYSFMSQITQTRVSGTGLGLALCRRLCELLGGSITVKSQFGAGSEFILTLPVANRNTPGEIGQKVKAT
jgi:signal transduction histidine kinase